MFQISHDEPIPSKNRIPSSAIKKLYQVIKRHTGKVSGYGHNCSIYGEITMGSFQKVVHFLKTKFGFDHNSLFLDIGSGLGKPNFHVLLDPGVRYSFGVELEALRYSLSLHNLSHMHEVPELSFLKDSPNIHFSHLDVTEIETFNPITHVYTFDVGMPPDTMLGISKAMQNSTSVKCFVSFNKPKKIIDDYEFPVEFVGSISTSMHGSSEGHKAYVYCHKRYKNSLFTVPSNLSVANKLGGGSNDFSQMEEALKQITISLGPRRSTRNRTRRITNAKENKKKIECSSSKKNPKFTSEQTPASISKVDFEFDLQNDVVFRKGFSVLHKFTNGKYQHWIKDELDVYFPKERPKRACSLKLMR